MAVRVIPNQLVKLYDAETFNQRNKRLMLDYRTYCQIVRSEQTTMFQLQLLPDSGNLVTNGDFLNDISGWNVINQTWRWASGSLQGEKTNAGQAYIQQYFTVTANKAHKLTLTAQFTNLSSTLTVAILNGANTNTTQVVYSAADYGTTPFEITLFWNSESDTTVYINLLLNGTLRDLVLIDDVEFYSLTEPVVTLETCAGELVKTIPVFARADDFINYAVDWFGLDEDCYRICISGVDDTEKNYLDDALALDTEGGEAIELEQGSNLNWYG